MPVRRFATTRWSLILAAHTARPDASTALATLCEQYWGPVHAFIRRSGRSDDDARDLAQAFFAMALEKDYFSQARRDRGRFRTFLLTSVRHFLANEHDARTALKRGGGAVHVPLDANDDEHPHVPEPGVTTTPEAIYERQWAERVFDLARARVREAAADTPRSSLVERLHPLLAGDDQPPYATLSAELGMSEGALRVAVHRLRRQFARALHDVIADTVATPEDVEDELRYLQRVLARD